MVRNDLEIITVHYNTPDLLWKLYNSIRTYIGYDVLFRVIDGSEGILQEFIDLQKTDTNFKFLRQGYNIHHGNGMHKAIETSDKKYILILDSDCIILKHGLIERMFELFNPDEHYAVGRVYKVNRHGFHVESDNFILYLHPKTMLLNKEKYLMYEPFKNHGAPCIYAMLDIDVRNDYNVLKNFTDITDYVFEKGRGTVERYGYGLNKLRNKNKIKDQRLKFNILVRTSGRPNYFKTCIDSIKMQNYPNYKIIVSYDDDQTYEYVSKYKGITTVKVDRINIPKERPTKFDEYIGRRRLYAPYNLYLNKMKNYCDQNAFIIILDDDDMFNDSTALYKIYHNIKSADSLVFWRVLFPNRVVPSDMHFFKKPTCCDIDSCGFSFNIKHWIDWDEWTMGDFRTSSMLFDKLTDRIYINKLLTKLQRVEANGLGRRDDK